MCIKGAWSEIIFHASIEHNAISCYTKVNEFWNCSQARLANNTPPVYSSDFW